MECFLRVGSRNALNFFSCRIPSTGTNEVLSAGTPDGALALLERSPHVDILFTNVDLKGELAVGIDLAQEAFKQKSNLKVLYTTERSVTDGMKARFVKNSAFLARPYTVEQLLATLAVYFRVSPQARRQ